MLVAKLDEYDREKLQQVIENLDAYDFFSYSDVDRWYMNTKSFSFYTGITVEFGCSKAVFICDDCDWVLKTNLKRDVMDKYDDYCRKEADHYEQAANLHLDKNFAACYFFEEVCGYEFYIQEKVFVSEEEVSSHCYDYISNYYNFEEEGYNEEERNERVYDCMYDMDDEERLYAVFDGVLTGIELDTLITFIQSADINDLHFGNFGYRYGDLGEPVIIDYSGF